MTRAVLELSHTGTHSRFSLSGSVTTLVFEGLHRWSVCGLALLSDDQACTACTQM